MIVTSVTSSRVTNSRAAVYRIGIRSSVTAVTTKAWVLQREESLTNQMRLILHTGPRVAKG